MQILVQKYKNSPWKNNDFQPHRHSTTIHIPYYLNLFNFPPLTANRKLMDKFVLEALFISVICILLLVQIFHFLAKIWPFVQYKDTINASVPPKNTLFFLIIVKNEAHQLQELLQALTKQRYKALKILVLDDHSDKEQYLQMSTTVGQFDQARSLSSEAKPGKKHAIYQFIKNTKQDALVFTDADCRPASAHYASLVASKLKDYEVVFGYGPFFKEVHFTNKLARFDTMWIAAQYFGAALRQKAYMAVGRNMAARTNTYLEVMDQIKAKELLSGDDDMFVQALKPSTKIGIMTNPESFMFSKSEENYLAFLRQKSRHIQTSVHYKKQDQSWLVLSAICSILIYPLLIAFLFINLPVGLGLVALKLLMSYLFYIPIAKKLQENDLILFVPLWECIYGLHLIVLAGYSVLSNNKKWK